MTAIGHSTKSNEPLVRLAAFTLADALAWAGHDCPGGCPESVTRTPASVWFLRRPADPGPPGPGRGSLLVIELGWPARHAVTPPGMLRSVNSCTRTDHLQVRERSSADRGHALDALDQLRGKAVRSRGIGATVQPGNGYSLAEG